MGIPIVSSLLGAQYIIYVAVYMLVFNLIIYTYGISLVRRSLEIIKKGLKILTTRRESAEDSESLIQSLRARK